MQAKAIVNFNSKPMLVLGGYGVTVIQWKVYEWTFPFHEFYSDWFIKKTIFGAANPAFFCKLIVLSNKDQFPFGSSYLLL